MQKRLDTPEHWISYRQQRNEVTSLIRTAKLSYYSNLYSKLSTACTISSKEWWKLCKYLYTGIRGDHAISELVVNENIIVKDEDKADVFNDYFNSISQVDNPFAPFIDPLVDNEHELSTIYIRSRRERHSC